MILFANQVELQPWKFAKCSTNFGVTECRVYIHIIPNWRPPNHHTPWPQTLYCLMRFPITIASVPSLL